MEETAMVKQEQGIEERHILDSPRDRLFQKAEKWRKEADEMAESSSLVKYRKKLEENYAILFFNLTERYMGISPYGVAILDEEEREALRQVIEKKSLRSYHLMNRLWIPLSSISFFGLGAVAAWFDNDFGTSKLVNGWRLYRCSKKIKKIHGDNYFKIVIDVAEEIKRKADEKAQEEMLSKKLDERLKKIKEGLVQENG